MSDTAPSLDHGENPMQPQTVSHSSEPLTYEQEIHSLLYVARAAVRDLSLIFERELETAKLTPEERRILRKCIDNFAANLARIDAAIPLAESRRSLSREGVPATQVMSEAIELTIKALDEQRDLPRHAQVIDYAKIIEQARKRYAGGESAPATPPAPENSDTRRLDCLAEQGNDWSLRGMMEVVGASGLRRLWFVGHGDDLVRGHAADVDSKKALRAAIDAAMQSERDQPRKVKP